MLEMHTHAIYSWFIATFSIYAHNLLQTRFPEKGHTEVVTGLSDWGNEREREGKEEAEGDEVP